jgi:glutamine synthetase
MHGNSIVKTANFDEWVRFFKANPDVQSIDAFIIDANGQVAGKRLEAADAEGLYSRGAQFSKSALIADVHGHGHDAGGFGKSDGDPDGNAMPLPGTLVRVPWSVTPAAQVVCQMTVADDGGPVWFDPRVILADVVAQCRSAGIHPVVACELEFYLIDPKRAPSGAIQPATPPGFDAPRRPGNLSLEMVDQNATFLNAVNAAAREQGLPVAGCVAEYGVGQFEVNLGHLPDPVLAADQAVLLKRLVRGVARSLGMEATFMAKPYVDQPGSGLHIHASIVDEDGKNRFGQPGGEALIEQGVAGMQALLYDSFAFFAPNFNSQRRYLSVFVPTSRDWGHNNRSVAFRIPPQTGSARRIEHRVAGADASPHLTMAAMLAGLLHGIRHQLTPTPPVDGRASHGGDADFPGDLIVALDRLVAGGLLAQYIPQRFLEVYAGTRRGEYLEFLGEIGRREYDFYA